MTRIEKAKKLYPKMNVEETILLRCPFTLLRDINSDCSETVYDDESWDSRCKRCWNMEV